MRFCLYGLDNEWKGMPFIVVLGICMDYGTVITTTDQVTSRSTEPLGTRSYTSAWISNFRKVTIEIMEPSDMIKELAMTHSSVQYIEIFECL